MLPRSRILRSIEVTKVLKYGKSVSYGQFVFKYIKSIENTSTRFSIAPSKKFYKRAVDRNTIKRKIFRLIRDFGEVPSGYKIVIMTKGIVGEDTIFKADIETFLKTIR